MSEDQRRRRPAGAAGPAVRDMPVRFKVRLRICPYCGGLAYPMGWPPDTSSLKAAKAWQKTFGDWGIGCCRTCNTAVMPFGWPPQRVDWSRLAVSG